MRWIADADLERLKIVEKNLENMANLGFLTASASLEYVQEVIANIESLQREQPHPEPKICAPRGETMAEVIEQRRQADF